MALLVFKGTLESLMSRVFGSRRSSRRSESKLPLPIPDLPQEAIYEIADDKWLADKVRFHLSLRDPYNQLVAAGMLVRLRKRPSIRTSAKATKLPVPSVLSQSSRWFMSLSEDHREILLRRLAIRLHGIEIEFEALKSVFNNDLDRVEFEVPILFSLVELLHSRDNLENATVVPRIHRRLSDDFESLLRSFDDSAVRFLRAVSFWYGPRKVRATILDAMGGDDEQFRRAACIDRQKWWILAARINQVSFFRQEKRD